MGTESKLKSNIKQSLSINKNLFFPLYLKLFPSKNYFLENPIEI